MWVKLANPTWETATRSAKMKPLADNFVSKIFQLLYLFKCFPNLFWSNEVNSWTPFVIPWTGPDSFLTLWIQEFSLVSRYLPLLVGLSKKIQPEFLSLWFFTCSICSISFANLFRSNEKNSQNSILYPCFGLDSLFIPQTLKLFYSHVILRFQSICWNISWLFCILDFSFAILV